MNPANAPRTSFASSVQHVLEANKKDFVRIKPDEANKDVGRLVTRAPFGGLRSPGSLRRERATVTIHRIIGKVPADIAGEPAVKQAIEKLQGLIGKKDLRAGEMRGALKVIVDAEGKTMAGKAAQAQADASLRGRAMSTKADAAQPAAQAAARSVAGVDDTKAEALAGCARHVVDLALLSRGMAELMNGNPISVALPANLEKPLRLIAPIQDGLMTLMGSKSSESKKLDDSFVGFMKTQIPEIRNLCTNVSSMVTAAATVPMRYRLLADAVIVNSNNPAQFAGASRELAGQHQLKMDTPGMTGKLLLDWLKWSDQKGNTAIPAGQRAAILGFGLALNELSAGMKVNPTLQGVTKFVTESAAPLDGLRAAAGAFSQVLEK